MNYLKAGKITHYYDKIGVAVSEVTDNILQVGDTIRIGDEETGFEQKIESMQVNHEQVEVAKIGDEVAIKLNNPAHENQIIFKGE